MSTKNKSDWQSEGYRIEYKEENDHFQSAYVYDSTGKCVGFAKFGPVDDIEGWTTLKRSSTHLFPCVTEVQPEHRRKGLASAMYKLVEEKSGKSLIPGGFQSEEAKSFWNNPNKQFGNK